MARRVNTKFVIILAAVLVLPTTGMVGYYGLRIWRNHDMAYQVKEGTAAESAGDYELAMRFYGRASELGAEKQDPAAADLAMKAAELYYASSSAYPERMGQAETLWKRALQVRPKFDAARDRLMQEYHDRAMAGLATWAALEKEAANLLRNDPEYGKGYLYRGEARLRQVNLETATQIQQEDIRADLEEAVRRLPDDVRPLELLARMEFGMAELAARGGQEKEAEERRQAALDRLMAFVEAHPKDAMGHLSLGQLKAALGKLDEARVNFEEALKLDSGSYEVLSTAGRYYLSARNLEEGERLYKLAADADTKSLRGRADYASLLATIGRREEALAEMKRMIEAKDLGTGLAYMINRERVNEAYFLTSQTTMELAVEKGGLGTAEGKALLQEAAGYIEKMRERNPNDRRVAILDGRLQLIRGKLADALVKLRMAEEGFTKYTPSVDRYDPVWCTLKLTLAEALTRDGNTGAALKHIDDLLRLQPRAPMAPRVLMQRAEVLRRQQSWDEALSTVDVFLKRYPDNAAAKRMKAELLMQLNRGEEASALLSGLGSPEAAVSQASMKINEGEEREALTILEGVLKTKPDFPPAIIAAASAWIQLAEKTSSQTEAAEHRARARKIIDDALARDPDSAQFKLVKIRLENPNVTYAELYEKIIEDMPTAFERNKAWANYYLMRGDLKKRLEHLQKAEEEAPGPDQAEALVDDIFEIALATRDHALASRYAQKAERANLDGVNGKLFQGRVEFAFGDKQVGLEAMRTAVAARGEYSMGHTVLGRAYIELRNFAEARKELTKAVEQKPDNLVAVRALIKLLIMQPDGASQAEAQKLLAGARKRFRNDPELRAINDLIGDVREAIAEREAIMARRPDDMDNLRRLGMVYARGGQRAKAIGTFTKVYEKFPDDMVVAAQLASLHQQEGQEHKAMGILQDLIARPDPVVKFNGLMLLGDLYRTKGSHAEAFRLYSEARQSQPKGSTEASRRLADLAFSVGNNAEAEKGYRELLEGSPEDPAIALRLAETQMRLAKYDEAEKVLESYVFKVNPKDRQGLVLKGISALNQNKPEDALKVFERMVADDPDSVDGLYYRAATRLQTGGDIEAILNDLIRARTLEPRRSDVRLLLAKAYREARRYSEAAFEYRDVLAQRPDAVAVRLEYAQFLYALSNIAMKLPADSADNYAQMLRSIKPVESLSELLADAAKRYPNQMAWPLMQGNLLWLQDRKEQSVQLLGALYDATNGAPEVAAAYLDKLLAQKLNDRAIDVATRMLTTYPNAADVHSRRAQAYAAKGKKAEALADFDKALELSEKLPPLFSSIARQAVGSLKDEGMALLTRRLAADANHASARVALGQVYAEAGKYSEASEVVQPLLAETTAARVRGVALRVAAAAAIRSKQPERALAYYETLLKMEPEDLESLNNVAFLLADDMKKPEEGLKYAQRAVDLLRSKPVEVAFQHTANVLDTYGWVKFLSGDTDGAVIELTRSVQADPLPAAYFHLAQVQKAQARFPEAKRSAAEAVRLATERKDPMLEEAKALLDELSKFAN